jgi:hypothetical protein
MSSDVLARVRAEIDARLVQLRPAVAEYERLLDAERALDADAAADAAKAARAAKAAGDAKPVRTAKAVRAAKAADAAKAVRAPKAVRGAKAVGAAKAAVAGTNRENNAQKQATKKENKQKEQPLQAAGTPALARSTSAATAPARRGRRGSAAGAIKRAASSPRDASQQAIVSALEHGSHTLGELVLVTAIAASELRQGVRRLQQAGTITRTQRDGRAAYALSSASTG